MSRKIWRLVFSIFIVGALVGLTAVLVLHDKKAKNNNNKPEDPSQQDETYATAYSFNIPDTIYILLDTEVKLSSGFITTTPTDAVKKLTHEVVPKSSGVTDGILFENNKITAVALGEYIIRFEIPKSPTAKFTKNLAVVVYEDATNGHIYQTNTSMFVGEEKNISDLFLIKNSTFYQVQTDTKTTFSNNIIKAITNGESEIIFLVKDNFLEYVYKFKVNIKEQPIYEIVLENIANNTIQIDLDVEPTMHIKFKVINRQEGYVEQVVDAVSFNENVVKIISFTEPFIKIEAVGVGETTIEITYSQDTLIKLQLKVNVS